MLPGALSHRSPVTQSKQHPEAHVPPCRQGPISHFMTADRTCHLALPVLHRLCQCGHYESTACTCQKGSSAHSKINYKCKSCLPFPAFPFARLSFSLNRRVISSQIKQPRDSSGIDTVRKLIYAQTFEAWLDLMK